MQNVTTSNVVDSAVASAINETTQELAVETTGSVAVLEQPAPEATLDQALEQAIAPDTETPATDPAPATQEPAAPAEIDPAVAARTKLLNARTFVLLCKQPGKKAGFGAKAGMMIRDTIGYKFDSMDIMECLKAMAAPDFLTRYQATLDRWHAGVKHDGNTGKSNAIRHTESSKLTNDPGAFAKLVDALTVLCERNQDWREKGEHLSISMNGHRAFLDFFGIQVTNNRRLKLSAS